MGKDAADYAPLTAELDKLVEAELARGYLPGVSIALVDDQQTLLVKGYGLADRDRQIKATADTVYRAGSISKLFTAVAVMQLVEQGKLSLDAPIKEYLPDFHIVSPFAIGERAKPIALRHLMSHRSGMVRESPVGGYFDPNQPTIEATLASLAPCVLSLPPEVKTKYSNVGPTIAGQIVSRVAGMPFEEYQQKHLLGPLGMSKSSFVMNERIKPLFAQGRMMIADGQGGWLDRPAPWFELGTMPAGNLYCSAGDLASFASLLLADGKRGDVQLIKSESLKEMFTPQFTSDPNGFGLGFIAGQFRDQKTISHNGAVYGFTTSLMVVPQSKVAVVVLSSADVAMGPVTKLNNAVLNLLLDAKTGSQAPAASATETPAAESIDFAALSGDFESPSYWAVVEKTQRGALSLNLSGQPLKLTASGPDKFVAEGRTVQQSPVVFERNGEGKVTGFTAVSQKFTRVDPAAVQPIPQEWKKYLGSYGPDFIPLVVTARHGHLYAMTENIYDYRLTPLNSTVFKAPPGMYEDEQYVFEIGADGEVYSVNLANMRLPRLPLKQPAR